MTNQTLLGGTVRVAFNGGTEIKRSLAFKAKSVNIDNWSPYWYRLLPVDEFIAPYQNGVNIRLQLLDNFEFRCEAPPGIEQSVLIASTLVPGNFNPVIAIFSSFDTNNDAGNSALQQASNVSENVISVSDVSPVNLPLIDLTLYNGIYFYIRARAGLQIDFTFQGVGVSFESYTMYAGEKLLFTIPKMSQTLQVSLLNPDPAPTINADYSIRPFFGYADFAVTRLGHAGANAPSEGNRETLVGSGAVSFDVRGIDNAIITLKTQTGVGNAFLDNFSVVVAYSNYLVTAGIRIWSKSFVYGEGVLPLIIPLFNIFQSQANSVSVNIVASNPVSTLDIALHHVDKPAEHPRYTTQIPHILTGTINIAPGAAAIMATVLQGANIVKMSFSMLVGSAAPGNTTMTISLGTAAIPVYSLFTMPTTIDGQYTVDNIPIIPMSITNRFIWLTSTAAVVCVLAYNIYTD